MKEIINFEISEVLVAFILILAFVLFSLMRLIKKYFIQRQLSSKYQQYYYLLEIVVWIMFLIWALKTILEDSIYYTIIVITIFLALAVWVTWFVVKDFIAGLVFKFNDDYKKGQMIEVNDYKGYVEDLNYLSLDLKSEDGEIIRIPYNKIQSSIHKKSIIDKSTIRHKYIIQIPNTTTFENIKEEIERKIILTPGVDLKKESIIKLSESTEEYHTIEVTVFILSESAIELINNNMEKLK